MSSELFCTKLPRPELLSRNMSRTLGKVFILSTDSYVSSRRAERLNNALFPKLNMCPECDSGTGGEPLKVKVSLFQISRETGGKISDLSRS